MRYLILMTAVTVAFTATASAAEHDRNMAVKLTRIQKPEVRVFSKNERNALARQAVELDLDVNPNQIICRTEPVAPGSRITTKRCKTRAEFRQQQEKNRNLYGSVIGNDKYKRRLRTPRVRRIRVKK
ncbi:MAG: hypothetical protein AB8G18_05630 [Gammaproteobacteria bacterium]